MFGTTTVRGLAARRRGCIEGDFLMRNFSSRRYAVLFCILGIVALAGGCKKNVPSSRHGEEAPPPSAAQPTVTLRASAVQVKSGDSVTLTWSSTDATDLNLAPGIGKVAPEGSVPVTPTQSTTYTITATGPGGTASASANITVGGAEEAPGPQANAGLDQLFQANVKDAFFEFNKAEIGPDARNALLKTAEFLRSYPQIRVSIEGHCDERGSTEYNLGLGQRRAQAARDYLVSLGIPAERMETVSWGKERPFCQQSTEECWQSNRRAHFVMIH
jgi:peptidoglycan-associated lipoprotein